MKFKNFFMNPTLCHANRPGEVGLSKLTFQFYGVDIFAGQVVLWSSVFLLIFVQTVLTLEPDKIPRDGSQRSHLGFPLSRSYKNERKPNK